MKNFKRFLSIALTVLLSFGLVFSFAGCNKQDESENETTYYTVTFDVQGGSAVASQKVEKDKTAKKPAAPTKDGYDFSGWYDAISNGKVYDFTKPVTADVTVYAYWNKKGGDTPVTPDKPTEKSYIMEAENVDLSFVQGGDTSASPQGASLIVEGENAHGGAFIRSLYVNELFLEFEFTSDVAVDNAKLIFSFAGEITEFSISNDEFQIYVNPELNDDYMPVDTSTRVKYSTIDLTPDYEFSEFEITAEMSIKEGTNIVYLLVSNTDSLAPTYSTMNAKAPMIDYMKIVTTANLTHVVYEN